MGFLWVSYKIPIGSYKEPNKPSDSLPWFDAGSPNPFGLDTGPPNPVWFAFHVFACFFGRCHVSPKMVKRGTPAFFLVFGRCHDSPKMVKRDTPAFFLVFGRCHSTSKTVSLNAKNGEA